MKKNNKLKKYIEFIGENNVIQYLIIGITIYFLVTLLTVRLKSANGDSSLNTLNNEEIKENYINLEKVLGFVDVKGEGIVITIEDGEELTQNSTRTDTIVHDSDLLVIVNELKASSADAISINDERITQKTAIRCVGPVIQVNFKPVSSPFVIKAIGNPKKLSSALSIKNGVLDILKNAGIKVNLEEKSEVTIIKYDGEMNLNYAK